MLRLRETRYTEQRRYLAHRLTGNTYVQYEKLGCKGLGKQGTLDQELSLQTLAIRLDVKGIYSWLARRPKC